MQRAGWIGVCTSWTRPSSVPNRLKQFRRIATRYEKRGVNYLAMVMLGMILLWL